MSERSSGKPNEETSAGVWSGDFVERQDAVVIESAAQASGLVAVRDEAVMAENGERLPQRH